MTQTPQITCQDVARQLRETGALDGAHAEHAEDCAVCTELADSGLESALSGARVPQARSAGAQFSELAEQIDQNSSWWTRLAEWRRKTRSAVLATVALAVVVGVGLTTLRPDWDVYPTFRMGSVLAVFVSSGVVTLHESLRPLYRPARTPRTNWGVALGLLGVGILVAALPVAHTSLPVALEGVGAALIPRAIECLAFGAIVGAPVVAVAAVLERSHPPRWSSLLLACAAAGMVGNAALQLHCPVVHQEHLLLGHASVSAVLIGLNLLLYPLLARVWA